MSMSVQGRWCSDNLRPRWVNDMLYTNTDSFSGDYNGNDGHNAEDQQTPLYDVTHAENIPQSEYDPSYRHTQSLPYETIHGEYHQTYRPDPPQYYQAQGQHLDNQYRKRPNYKPSALRWPFLTILLITLLTVMGLLAYGLRGLPIEGYDISVTPDGKRMVRRADEEAPTTSEPAASTPGTIVGTTPSGGLGVTESVTITANMSVVSLSAANTKHGNIGSVTITTFEPAYSKASASHGNIGSVTITTVEPAYSKASASHGNFGSVTITTSEPTYSKASDSHGNIGTVSITTSEQPISYVSAAVTTLTNSLGIATHTSTSIPSAISTQMTTVMTNSVGEPTTTAVTSVLATPIISTMTNAEGLATATVTGYPVLPSSPTAHVRVYYISAVEYAVGFFLPTVLSILIAIPIRILDLNAKLFQPWHELTHAHGATGLESLCLETGGWRSIVTSVRSLLGGQALVFLTTTLVVCSSILVPLSAEAVGLNVEGGCRSGEAAMNCAYELSVFDKPAKATLALLGFMVIIIVLIICFLARWKSGVSTNPWSICGIASLGQNMDVRSLFTTSLPAGVGAGGISAKLLKDAIGMRRFTLGWFKGSRGGSDYGLMLHDLYPEGHPLYQPISATEVGEKSTSSHQPAKTRHHLPFMMMGFFGRFLLLFVLCGLLGLVLYYNNTGGDTPFEGFMDSESFGVKFFFTAIGVIITFIWSSFFSSKSRIAVQCPKHLLILDTRHRRNISLPPSSLPATTSTPLNTALSAHKCLQWCHLGVTPASSLPRAGRGNRDSVRISDRLSFQHPLPGDADLSNCTHMYLERHRNIDHHGVGCARKLLRKMAANARRPEHYCWGNVLCVRQLDAGWA